MFQTAFREDPMSAEVGQAYRTAVLEKGGSENGQKLVADFLGRASNPKAFLKQLAME